MGFVVGEASVEHPKIALSHNAAELETQGANELTAADHLGNAGKELGGALDLLHQALGQLGAYQPEVDEAYAGHKPAADGLGDLSPKLSVNVRTSPRKDAHDAVRRVGAEVDPAAEDTDSIKGYVDLGKDVIGALKKIIKKVEDSRAVPGITTTAQRMTERGGAMKKDAAVLSETARDW